MKRLKREILQPADIVLTTSTALQSGAIRAATKSEISHAILVLNNSSLIEATGAGVHSENPQRLFYEDELAVFVLRMEEPLSDIIAKNVCDFARVRIGAEYSVLEAARTQRANFQGNPNSLQFCSRLVAQAYESVGIILSEKGVDYCTPEDIKNSSLLIEINEPTELISEKECELWKNHDSGIDKMKSVTNAMLDGVRKLDSSVIDISDVINLVVHKPELDEIIFDIVDNSGYFSFWDHDIKKHPHRYDINIANKSTIPKGQLKKDFEETLKSDHNVWFSQRDNFARMVDACPLKTLEGFLELYKNLCNLATTKHSVATTWLDSR